MAVGWEHDPGPPNRDRHRALEIGELAPDGYGTHAETLGLVGRSRAVLELGHRIAALAPSPATVFVHGETGTGKELIARALHSESHRSERPFLPHNFASIPDSLVESELFGHAKGSFTGAHADRPGLFELANGGTLFLDEIGDASPSVQSRLLRVLQEGEVRRVGDGRVRRVDVRIVAATHRDLAAEVRSGRFRADLFYRLHVLTIRAPSLRERSEDVPLLIAHILRRLSRRQRPEARRITGGALEVLVRYPWPGNVRELETALERAVHALGPGGTLTHDSLGEGLAAVDVPVVRERAENLRGRTRELEAEMIQSALRRTGGNRTRAALSLGLTRQGLWKKIRRLARDEAAAEARAVAASIANARADDAPA
ncbi:MAG TPA: sigma-54 dependent transcriptional regulator [Candidatus Dormibacteraeota bacterium]|nr:sigma-54 dependent transcriptional regulator [Candidatus Dormibacteraeota bacterium]